MSILANGQNFAVNVFRIMHFKTLFLRGLFSPYKLVNCIETIKFGTETFKTFEFASINLIFSIKQTKQPSKLRLSK